MTEVNEKKTGTNSLMFNAFHFPIKIHVKTKQNKNFKLFFTVNR